MSESHEGTAGARRAGRLAPRLVLARAPLGLSGSGFLFDGSNAESYSTNRTAAAVLEALLGGVDSREAWRSVVERFDVADDVARRDVERFLSRLRELGLVRTVDE